MGDSCDFTVELRAHDGLPLTVRTWTGSDSLKAVLLFVHGMGEHGGRYGHIARMLTEEGVQCHAMDLRGHGRSSGSRGDVLRYDDFINDLAVYFSSMARNDCPLFAYAHSLGGQLLINFLTQRAAPEMLRGVIINGPWLALAYRPARWKLLLAMVMRHAWPSLTQSSGTLPEMMSRDMEFLRSMPELDLTHKRMSARLFHLLRMGASTASRAAPKFHWPMLLMHGGDDPVTSCQASEKFFHDAASPDKTLRIHRGLRHETHNEIGRETVLTDVCQWIEDRISRIR